MVGVSGSLDPKVLAASVAPLQTPPDAISLAETMPAVDVEEARVEWAEVRACADSALAVVALFVLTVAGDKRVLWDRINRWFLRRATATAAPRTDDARWVPVAALLVRGLRSLPAHSGMVYRAVPGLAPRPDQTYAVGTRILWPYVASVVRKESAARRLAASMPGVSPGITLFAITTTRARIVGSLAAVPEDEMLFEPNSEFVVTALDVSSEAVIVSMRHEESRVPFLPVGVGESSPSSVARMSEPGSAKKHKHSSGKHRPKKSSTSDETAEPQQESPAGPSAATAATEDEGKVRTRSRTRSDETALDPKGLPIVPHRKIHSSAAVWTLDTASGTVSPHSSGSQTPASSPASNPQIASRTPSPMPSPRTSQGGGGQLIPPSPRITRSKSIHRP
jgi:hypothetical protein